MNHKDTSNSPEHQGPDKLLAATELSHLDSPEPSRLAAPTSNPAPPGFFRRLFQKYILEKIPSQLNAHTFSAELSIGFFIGTCPLLGTHTLAALGLSFIFGLNYAVVLLGTLVSAPLLILLLYPEKILGEWLLGQPPVDFRPVVTMFEDTQRHMGVDIWANMSAMVVLAENLGRTFVHILAGWVPMGLGTAFSVYLCTRLMIFVYRRKKELNRPHATLATEEPTERYLQNG